MCSFFEKRFSFFGTAIFCAALALAGCGGGGSGGTSATDAPVANNPSTGTPQGTVGIVITDAPSDKFDQVLATITRIELLGDDEPVTIFDGMEQIDLKRLADFSELFAVAAVDAKIYDKIRLTLTDLELVRLNDDGTVAESVHPRLPGNGKIDLNPRREFLVTDGGTLLLEMDFDIEKSFKVHESGNGEYHFRPVVFVRVLTDGAAGRLSRVYGRIGRVDTDRFELCQTELMSDMDDDSDFEDEHCVEVLTSADTGIFAPTGDPTDVGSIMTGGFATAIGFISGRDDEISMLASTASDDDSDGGSGSNSDDGSDDDSGGNSGDDSGADSGGNSGDDSGADSGSNSDDDSDSDSDGDSDGDSDDDRFTLEAVVIELGEAGTFAHLKGTAQSGVNDSRQFDLLLAPEQGFGDASMVTAQLQDGSKIYSRRGVRLDDTAIMDGVRGVFDGVLMLANDAPDLLKTALAVLDIDVDGEEVLRGEILTASDDRRLMLATATGDRCVDVPLDTDIFLVKLVEGRLVSDRGSYSDLQPGLNIDVYGEMGAGGCFIADTIIADETDVTPPPSENRPPVANAGSDRPVETGTGVMLDGTGSSDPDGDTLSYSWTLDVPAGSSASLSAADTATPSFTADMDGDYVATLVVNDGALDSAPDTVTITASATPPPANQAPIADAGPNQTVDTGTEVTLNGNGSSDPENDAIAYSWTLSAPGGSAASLSGADTPNPTFTPDVDGDYVAKLIVNDGQLDSDPDSVTVTASTPVTLDGVQLYADNCEGCHNPIASSDKRGASAAEIQDAIEKDKGGMGFLSFLTADEIQAIADALSAP